MTAFTSQPVRAARWSSVSARTRRAGIFETMLFSEGAAPLLDAQLERLAASAGELYGLEITRPAGRTPPSGTGRLRVTFVPRTAHRRSITGRAGRIPATRRSQPFVLPGGLGPHKWLDRRLLDAITVVAGDGALPLLIDADGSVLEATLGERADRGAGPTDLAAGRWPFALPGSVARGSNTTRSRSISTGSSLLTPWC